MADKIFSGARISDDSVQYEALSAGVKTILTNLALGTTQPEWEVRLGGTAALTDGFSVIRYGTSVGGNKPALGVYSYTPAGTSTLLQEWVYTPNRLSGTGADDLTNWYTMGGERTARRFYTAEATTRSWVNGAFALYDNGSTRRIYKAKMALVPASLGGTVPTPSAASSTYWEEINPSQTDYYAYSTVSLDLARTLSTTSKLVPGRLYRITERSGGATLDVLLFAISKKTFNEADAYTLDPVSGTTAGCVYSLATDIAGPRTSGGGGSGGGVVDWQAAYSKPFWLENSTGARLAYDQLSQAIAAVTTTSARIYVSPGARTADITTFSGKDVTLILEGGARLTFTSLTVGATGAATTFAIEGEGSVAGNITVKGAGATTVTTFKLANIIHIGTLRYEPAPTSSPLASSPTSIILEGIIMAPTSSPTQYASIRLRNGSTDPGVPLQIVFDRSHLASNLSFVVKLDASGGGISSDYKPQSGDGTLFTYIAPTRVSDGGSNWADSNITSTDREVTILPKGVVNSPITLTQNPPQVVASQAAMLALSSAVVGDLAIRTDVSKTYVLSALPPSTLGNWLELLTPAGSVMSVNGVLPDGGGDVEIGIADIPTLQDELNDKEPTIVAGTTSEYWRGDKSWQTLNKSAVGLGNVDNTSDVNKPISTATQTALDLKANTTHTHTLSQISQSGAAVGEIPKWNGTNWVPSTDLSGSGGGGGTVTSVSGTGTVSGLILSGTVLSSGSLTLSGTLVVTPSNFGAQTATYVLIGPTTGGAATPTFRALVAGDIPNLPASQITSGTMATARLGTGTADATSFLRGDSTWTTDGSTLTSLNASNISSGTLNTARLPLPTTSTIGAIKRNTGSAGEYVTGVDASGNLLYDTPLGTGNGSVTWTSLSIGSTAPCITSAGLVKVDATSGRLLTRYKYSVPASGGALTLPTTGSPSPPSALGIVEIDGTTLTPANGECLQLSLTNGYGTAIWIKLPSSQKYFGLKDQWVYLPNGRILVLQVESDGTNIEWQHKMSIN